MAICGGSGSGKSVYAYIVASSLLKEHQFDVVYVNWLKEWAPGLPVLVLVYSKVWRDPSLNYDG